jgi:hypothetical protein
MPDEVTTAASTPAPLTSDEVAAVLRRAAELDAELATPQDAAADRVGLAAVEQAAAEVGISVEAVRLAYAELRVGGLPDEPAAPPPRRIIGPPTVAEQKVVYLPPDEVRDRVGRWLRQQTFELRRSSPESSRWKRREDMSASMRRTFDFSKKIKLEDPRAITVQLTEVVDRDGRPATLVRLEADTGQIRTGATVGAVACAAVGGGFVGIMTAIAGAPPVAPELLIGLGAGWAALTPVGLGIARWGYARKRETVAEVLGMFLDQLG